MSKNTCLVMKDHVRENSREAKGKIVGKAAEAADHIK